MTSNQEGHDPYAQGTPPAAGGYEAHPPQQGAGPAYGGPGGYPAQTTTSQFPQASSGHYPGDQSHQSHHGPLSRADKLNVKNSLRSTEFWVFVVVSLALLIAAAVSDGGDGGSGFGAENAWKYVTVLAVAYIVSRGLAKFSGRDDDRDDDRHQH